MPVLSPVQPKRTRWLRMTPRATRQLADAIARELIPLLIEAGFCEVACWYGSPEHKVSGREIRMERLGDTLLDSVHIAFDKYRRPLVSVSIARRRRKNPSELVRGANVTKSSRRYWTWWGKPWWMPTLLWSELASVRVGEQLATITPQILRFLETGERGTNIGRSADGIAY